MALTQLQKTTKWRNTHREHYNFIMAVAMKKRYHFQKEWKRLCSIDLF